MLSTNMLSKKIKANTPNSVAKEVNKISQSPTLNPLKKKKKLIIDESKHMKFEIDETQDVTPLNC